MPTFPTFNGTVFQSDWDSNPLGHLASQHDWSSIPPNQHALSGGLDNPYNFSRLSGSSPAHARSSHTLDSFSVDDHASRNSGSRAVLTSHENPRIHSHISIHSDDHDSGSRIFHELRIENQNLKRLLQDSRHHAKPDLDLHEGIYENLHDSIHETRDAVQKLVTFITTNFTGQVPGIISIGIPLILKQDDYNCKFWNQALWQFIRNTEKAVMISPFTLFYFLLFNASSPLIQYVERATSQDTPEDPRYNT
ncbi:hypothetical protein BJ322DRAFT_1106944 [Thelephora terrestris]|uniref:Uncharacterized protein n=1 Tax=Thelephora terrestris TaxID=56493 RepID=A0A9P6L7L9_9AGAM|nr:hypothetical protein BJ322DRAFT_1106944 [Thelephora terrestris]